MTGRARRAPRPTSWLFGAALGLAAELDRWGGLAPHLAGASCSGKATRSAGSPSNEVKITLTRQHVLTDSSADARGPTTSADQVRDRAGESGSRARSIVVDRAKQFFW